MREPDGVDPGDLTLRAYDRAAECYATQTSRVSPASTAFLDRVAGLVGTGEVLELGSGPGWDAAYLEGLGVRVHRTDATPAFLEMMRADGYPARHLDVRTDEFGGPFSAVLACAVLLHLSRPHFTAALGKARSAVGAGGLLAFTIKEGDGEEWSTRKLDLPRHFTYWRADAVRAELMATGWQVVSLDHVDGLLEPWLHVIARAG